MIENRALMPDYLRLIALFGIVVVNVQAMAFSVEHGFVGATQQSMIDQLATWLVNGLAYLKAYGLFSFMFGVGLAYMMRSAEQSQTSFGKIYRNRMIGLAFLGILHGVLFFVGDILSIYALIGVILYFWRDWEAGRLWKVGGVLIVLQVVIAAVMVYNYPEPNPVFIDYEREVMTNGSIRDVLEYRGLVFVIGYGIGLIFQAIAALGWLCLGLAAVKSGLIDQPDHALWKQARKYLAPAVIISLLAAASMQWEYSIFAAAVVVVIAPVVTIGYLGLIASLKHPVSAIMQYAIMAGGSSLTIYLGQSIILSTVFSPYGLGLWDKVGPATAIVIALVSTVLLIAFVTLWRLRFNQGPFEWILRKITWWGIDRTQRP